MLQYQILFDLSLEQYELNVPIISATQTTRGGYDNSDVGLTDTSESFGLPATADFMVALIATDELKEMNQMMIKQLKNRYSDPDTYKRIIVGVDRRRMRLYDAESSAQDDIIDSGQPVFDKTPSGDYFDTKTGELFDRPPKPKPNFKGLTLYTLVAAIVPY